MTETVPALKDFTLLMIVLSRGRRAPDQQPPTWLCPAHLSSTSVDGDGPRAENTLWAPGSGRVWPEEAIYWSQTRSSPCRKDFRHILDLL